MSKVVGKQWEWEEESHEKTAYIFYKIADKEENEGRIILDQCV